MPEGRDLEDSDSLLLSPFGRSNRTALYYPRRFAGRWSRLAVKGSGAASFYRHAADAYVLRWIIYDWTYPMSAEFEEAEFPAMLADVGNRITAEPLVEDAALGFEENRIKMPDIPNRAALLAELMAFEAVPLPNGMTRFSAPSGGKDDLVIALLLAYRASHSTPIGYRPYTH